MAQDPNKRIRYLSGFITDTRKDLFERVLEYRTRYITVVLEDIYQSQNASAVLRSCECFGIQDVHIIENKNEYRVNPDVVMGASKWLNLYKYRGEEFNTMNAVAGLREKGYRIVATTTREGSVSLEEFDLRKGKTALFFGTELTGLSDTMIKQADECLQIPMHGFTKSFNISVSAAIILHHLTLTLHRSGEIPWQICEEERDEIMIEWLYKSIKHLRGKSPENQL